MNDSTKKVVIIIVAILAVVGAVFSAIKFTGGEQIHVEKTINMPAGFKSEKQQALDAQAAGSKTAPPAERDLSK